MANKVWALKSLVQVFHSKVITSDIRGRIGCPPNMLHISYLRHSICKPCFSVGLIRQEEDGNDHCKKHAVWLGLGLVYCYWLLLLCGPSACGDMDSKPMLPTDCNMIHQSRARLAAKDRIETLEINFTEIGENYLSLYAELDAITIHDFRYQNETWAAMNCSLVDLCKTSRSVDDIIDLQLPSYMGFLTNVLKLDKSTIVAFLFQNRSSVVISERTSGFLNWMIFIFLFIPLLLVGC